MPDPEGGMPEGSTEPKWADLFIDALRTTRSVEKACQAVGRSRSAVYEWRGKSPSFTKRWDEAFEEARAARFERLEISAFDRATDGTKRPILHDGIEVATYQHYETALTIFLLKVHGGPKYRMADAGGQDLTAPQIAAALFGLIQVWQASVPPPPAAAPPALPPAAPGAA